MSITKKKRLRIMILQFNIISLFICTALIIAVVFIMNVNTIKKKYNQEAQMVCQEINKQITITYENQMNLAKMLATCDIVVNATRWKEFNTVESFLSLIYNQMSIHENIFISTISKSTNSKHSVIKVAAVDGSVGIDWGGIGYDDSIVHAVRGESWISTPHLSPVTGRPVVLFSVPIVYQGKVIGIFGLPLDVGNLAQRIITDVRIGEKGYVFLTDTLGTIIAHPNANLIFKDTITNHTWGKLLIGKASNSVVRDKKKSGTVFYWGEMAAHNNMMAVAVINAHDIYKSVFSITTLLALLIIVLFSMPIIGGHFFMKYRLKPLEDATCMIKDIAAGKVLQSMPVVHNDEVGDMVSAMNALNEKIIKFAYYLRLLSSGDLSVMVNLDFGLLTDSLKNFINNFKTFCDQTLYIATGYLKSDVSVEFGYAGAAINLMSKKLNDIVSNIAESSEQVAASSEELASTAANLAEGSQNQAALVEETSAAIETVNASLEEMLKLAVTASKLLYDSSADGREEKHYDKYTDTQKQDAVSKAHFVARISEEALMKMQAIEESSKDMAQFLTAIKDIADNTSLLSLNASIEAARAGEAGRGFAVVADNVSKLAERSGQAVKEIEKLIVNNNKKISEGATLFNKVVESVIAIKDTIQESAQQVETVAHASQEQALQVDAMAKSMQQVNEITQQVAAASEETASSTEELTSHAQSMAEIVSFFKMSDEVKRKMSVM